MNMRPTIPTALLVFAGAAVGGLASGVSASEAGMAAAEQVSQASYRDFLDNWLFTHAGDNRGFGPEHDPARDNIEAIFLSYGLDVHLHPFQYSSTTYYNVVATMTGTVHPDQEFAEYLLCGIGFSLQLLRVPCLCIKSHEDHYRHSYPSQVRRLWHPWLHVADARRQLQDLLPEWLVYPPAQYSQLHY